MSRMTHEILRKKFSLALMLATVLFSFGACRHQQNRVAFDPRFGLPQDVAYDDIEYYESFSMPRHYAGTTLPDHWIDAPPAGNRAGMVVASHGPSCPCCAGATSHAQQTMSQQNPGNMTQAMGQSQTAPQQAAQQQTFPGGKFSFNQPEPQRQQHFENDGILIRGQSPGEDDDLFGWGGDDDLSGGFDLDGTDTGDNLDSGFGDFDTGSTVTTPTQPASPQPAGTTTPTTGATTAGQSAKELEAEREAQKRKEAAIKARPVQDDSGIQITFDRRQKSPVHIDPNLKKQGQNIVNNPQIYSEFQNPGGFQFRGIHGAWPQDEYLVDGGDDGVRAYVRNNWEIRGLEPEDTIAHYDTLDNRRLVEKSNRVHIYSPRFGSVRKIDGIVAAVEWQHYAAVQTRNLAGMAQNRIKTGRVEQGEQADYARSQAILRSANAGANTGTVGVNVVPESYQNREMAVAWAQLMTHKIFTGAELAYLAQGKSAAVAWGGIDRVEVRINEQAAQAMIGEKTPEAVFIIGEPDSSPKLKLFKVASKETAQRGEIVEFMIRFDNVGSELVGNVTIVDSLTTRLEYIEGSAGSSVPAEFFVEPNAAGSTILRWEINEPLKAGDFGVVRFRCRVQ